MNYLKIVMCGFGLINCSFSYSFSCDESKWLKESIIEKVDRFVGLQTRIFSDPESVTRSAYEEYDRIYDEIDRLGKEYNNLNLTYECISLEEHSAKFSAIQYMNVSPKFLNDVKPVKIEDGNFAIILDPIDMEAKKACLISTSESSECRIFMDM